MNRRRFVINSALLITGMESLAWLRKVTSWIPESGKSMPVLFAGHGSPVNGIEDNEFSNTWKQWGRDIPVPSAVICISAHWLTNGVYVTAMQNPKTIHDFSGFPEALYQVQYPAKGHPVLAAELANNIAHSVIGLNHDWGLDHGCWTILRHMYPQADVPVLQLSIDYSKPASWHFELARELKTLRKKNILITGSGNMVHNLRLMSWNKPSGFAYGWASDMNHQLKQLILKRDFKKLLSFQNNGREWNLAIPTPDHYYPLVYMLGLTGSKDEFRFFNDKVVMGSIAMTSVMASG